VFCDTLQVHPGLRVPLVQLETPVPGDIPDLQAALDPADRRDSVDLKDRREEKVPKDHVDLKALQVCLYTIYMSVSFFKEFAT